MITLNEVGIRAGKHWLVRGITCDIDAGECLAFTGQNGSGKSTLLRCVYGMQTPNEGTVTVAAREPDERDSEFRRRVSVLLDDSDFFAELTPEQHLELLAESFGSDIDVGARLADAGLDERIGVTAGHFSAGQRRRLMLLGATARPFEVLLLDEPERALDTEGKEWLTTLVTRAKEADAAVVLATHYAPLLEVADTVVGLA